MSEALASICLYYAIRKNSYSKKFAICKTHSAII